MTYSLSNPPPFAPLYVEGQRFRASALVNGEPTIITGVFAHGTMFADPPEVTEALLREENGE